MQIERNMVIIMKFEEKLQMLRKEKRLSQEGLAELLGVTRQSISKWESGQTYPEMEKLIILSELFGTTLDSLVKDNELERNPHNLTNDTFWLNRGNYYEYKSSKTLWGLPLIHINIGKGNRKAKGIIAIGNAAVGFVSIGFGSIGVISLGLASIGLISFGVVSLAVLFSIGTFSVGTISIGAISVGVFTIGAISTGMFSLGALVSATHVALGHTAHGHIAIGEVVEGVRTIKVDSANHIFSTVSKDQMQDLIHSEFPNLAKWISNFIISLFQ